MTKQKNYKKTLIACYLGFVTQAISANFTPLLFLTFKNLCSFVSGAIRSRACFNGYSAWNASCFLCRYSDCSHPLCYGQWSYWSISKPDCGSLSFWKQRWDDEFTTLLLLLGGCRCDFRFHPLFYSIWCRKLEDTYNDLGSGAVI